MHRLDIRHYDIAVLSKFIFWKHAIEFTDYKGYVQHSHYGILAWIMALFSLLDTDSN